jgi:hypothetical protein
LDRATDCLHSFGDEIEICGPDPQRWVRLRRGRELLCHPDVELMATAGKPDATAVLKSLRLFQFRQPKQSSVEAPGLALASDRRGDLYVVQPNDLHPVTVAKALDSDRSPGVRRMKTTVGRDTD